MSAIKVLQIAVGGRSFNGVVSFLYQYYKHMDHEKVQFDFLFIRENALETRKDDPIFKNSTFYVLNAIKRNKKTNHFKMIEGLDKVLAQEHYDVVHINTLSVGANVLLIHVCKKHNIKTIISHSHNEYEKGISTTKLLAHKFFQPYIIHNADHLFACSVKAGCCLFGEKGIQKNNFKVIKNAIDPGLFGFSNETRERTRNMFNIDDETIIIGQIGRLAVQKNQKFAIDVFESFHKKVSNSQFWIVGSGPDEEKLKEIVNNRELNSAIKFWGQRTDVNDMLNAMDVLLFPSLWEGLSIAAIEAQATGIHILASENVTAETAITDLVTFLPLNVDLSIWSNKLLELAKQYEVRRDRHECLKNSGFTIVEAAKLLERFYCTQVVD